MQHGLMITAIIAAAAIAIAGIAFYGYAPAERQDAEAQVRLLAASLGDRMDNSVKVMRLTSVDPAVQGTGALSQISEAQMGIPQDADPAKRQAAQNVLEQYGDFASIFFLTPGGDLYMGEPYRAAGAAPAPELFGPGLVPGGVADARRVRQLCIHVGRHTPARGRGGGARAFRRRRAGRGRVLGGDNQPRRP
ncbi:hypothetical protein [Candidatus Nitrososphaera sp. FF02]|uniref:hypothetical protein n=1 Tax=Candidatus Nitrososphaera sp. FF02 TaxID=3398226 RepID=UPI0039E75630